MEQIKKYRLETLVVVLLIGTSFIAHALYRESTSTFLTIAFLDVGQGDSIFIESPTKNRIIIDGGPNAAITSELGKMMPWYARWIDLLLVTHPDADHFAGFIDLLKQYQTGVLVESSVESDSKVYTQFITHIDDLQATRVSAMRGMVIDIGGGAYLDILFPDRDVSKMDTNDASIITKLVYGSTTVLLTGDAPSAIENYLVMIEGDALKSDILKVGHHGSKTSTAETFVAQVAPQFAVISAGKDNRYGHPHAEVVKTLHDKNITVYSTASEGTIIFKSDGTTFIQK